MPKADLPIVIYDQVPYWVNIRAPLGAGDNMTGHIDQFRSITVRSTYFKTYKKKKKTPFF